MKIGDRVKLTIDLTKTIAVGNYAHTPSTIQRIGDIGIINFEYWDYYGVDFLQSGKNHAVPKDALALIHPLEELALQAEDAQENTEQKNDDSGVE